MKKIILTFCLFITALTISAQTANKDDYSWKAELGVSNFFRSRIQFVEGQIGIGQALAYHLTLQRPLPYQRSASLSYTFVPTELSFTPGRFYTDRFDGGAADMNIHFISAVGTQHFGSGNVLPFFDAGLGIAIYDITNNTIDTKVHFLMNFGTGVEFLLGERLGLKLDGGVKMPLLTQGSGVYCGIGGSSGVDCGLSINSNVIMIHWGLGGAVTYNF